MRNHQTLILFLLANLLFGQEISWHEVTSTMSYNIQHQNSDIDLDDLDQVMIALYTFDKIDEIDLNNISNIQFSNVPSTFRSLKSKFPIDELKISLKQNSEYLIKLQSENPYKIYEIYFKNIVKQYQISEFENSLNQRFNLEKIDFISKDKAKEIAFQELGIDNDEFFEESIFPASLRIYSQEKLSIEAISNIHPDWIDEVLDKSEIGVIILKINS